MWGGWSGATADNWQDQWDFKLGATPSNYLRTKGWRPQVWRTGLGGPGKEVCWGGAVLTIPLISEGI